MKKPRRLLVLSAIAALPLITGGYLIGTGVGAGADAGRSSESKTTPAARSSQTGPVTQPLRDEHAKLLPEVERLRTAADAVGDASGADLREKAAAAHAFLADRLVPHAQAEDEVLYKEIDRLLGDVPVTATMSRDHVQVAKLTAELGALEKQLTSEPNEKTQRELRRVLYGAYTLVTLHFAKEEEVFLPILDKRLTAEQARRLFARMDEATTHEDHHG